MLVLISYDVNTEDAAGHKRLRQIAKQCVNYGQRVQNSVFECVLDAAQCRQLQHKLCALRIRRRTACGFTTSETIMRPRWSTLASRQVIRPRAF